MYTFLPFIMMTAQLFSRYMFSTGMRYLTDTALVQDGERFRIGDGNGLDAAIEEHGGLRKKHAEQAGKISQ